MVLIACSRPSSQTTATRDALAKLLGWDAFSSQHLPEILNPPADEAGDPLSR